MAACVVDDPEECCAICFEHRLFVQLPCSCKTNYCAACWDRALARSVEVRGRAECPSCRGAFRVDYDPDNSTLIFSADQRGTAAADWQGKIYSKVRREQVRLLKCHGMALRGRHGHSAASTSKGGGFLEECLGKAPAAEEVAALTSEASMRSADDQSQSASVQQQPRCVCGSELERVSTKDRMNRLMSDWDPSRGVTVLDAFIMCDLCAKGATRTGAVWTCRSGSHTLLHPAAYDVCERCFDKYVGAADPAAGSCGRGFLAWQDFPPFRRLASKGEHTSCCSLPRCFRSSLGPASSSTGLTTEH